MPTMPREDREKCPVKFDAVGSLRKEEQAQKRGGKGEEKGRKKELEKNAKKMKKSVDKWGGVWYYI